MQQSEEIRMRSTQPQISKKIQPRQKMQATYQSINKSIQKYLMLKRSINKKCPTNPNNKDSKFSFNDSTRMSLNLSVKPDCGRSKLRSSIQEQDNTIIEAQPEVEIVTMTMIQQQPSLEFKELRRETQEPSQKIIKLYRVDQDSSEEDEEEIPEEHDQDGNTSIIGKVKQGTKLNYSPQKTNQICQSLLQVQTCSVIEKQKYLTLNTDYYSGSVDQYSSRQQWPESSQQIRSSRPNYQNFQSQIFNQGIKSLQKKRKMVVHTVQASPKYHNEQLTIDTESDQSNNKQLSGFDRFKNMVIKSYLSPQNHSTTADHFQFNFSLKNIKKMTKKESDKMFSRLMNYQKKKDEAIDKIKKTLIIKEQEEVQVIQTMHQQKIKKKELQKCFENLSNDADLRKKKYQDAIQKKKVEIDDQLSTYFKPQLIAKDPRSDSGRSRYSNSRDRVSGSHQRIIDGVRNGNMQTGGDMSEYEQKKSVFEKLYDSTDVFKYGQLKEMRKTLKEKYQNFVQQYY
ncbi:UNKNOWN [Stylonychia lemnae]|uniref:Uncharacterized protein n=1 Tax=Stylonychia lemnae TaxID=5949 RepID=A0A078AAM3_STYLE|nr:UNKNOWN [Stylonychia lemnae]|eukprot:CDW78637.1 UNKNOWN [Stylonychia lemnae]